MMSDYISVDQVASLLGIHKATVFKLTKRGLLPRPFKISHQVTRWRLSEVEKYLDDKRASDLEG